MFGLRSTESIKKESSENAMRITWIVFTLVYCCSGELLAQGFLDQLENVIEAEAAAEAARLQRLKENQPTEAAAPGYLGLVAVDSSGTIVVESVRDGAPAHKAGMRTGDVLLKVGPHEVSSLDEMGAALSPLRAGDETKIHVRRGDEIFELNVKLGQRPKVLSPAPAVVDEIPEVRGDGIDALRELEAILDEAPAELEPPKVEAPPAAVDAERRAKRLAEVQSQLDLMKRRIAELERELSELSTSGTESRE